MIKPTTLIAINQAYYQAYYRQVFNDWTEFKNRQFIKRKNYLLIKKLKHGTTCNPCRC